MSCAFGPRAENGVVRRRRWCDDDQTERDGCGGNDEGHDTSVAVLVVHVPAEVSGCARETPALFLRCLPFRTGEEEEEGVALKAAPRTAAREEAPCTGGLSRAASGADNACVAKDMIPDPVARSLLPAARERLREVPSRVESPPRKQNIIAGGTQHVNTLY